MRVAKEVLSSAAAVAKANNAAPAAVAVAVKTPAKAESRPKWRFIKRFGVGEQIRFRDGTVFQFRPIERGDGYGFEPTSELTTDDPKLAENLRRAGANKGYGIVEVKL